MNRTDDETGGKEIIPGPDCAAGDRLEAQIRFLMEADREKEIVRQNYLASGNRRETDAEHAWHMALMVMLLSEYANEPIDRYRTMCLCLAHDLVAALVQSEGLSRDDIEELRNMFRVEE